MKKYDKCGDAFKYAVTVEILKDDERLFRMNNLMACLGKLIMIHILNSEYAHGFPYRELIYDAGSRSVQALELSSMVLDGVRLFKSQINTFEEVVNYLNYFEMDEWLYCYPKLLSVLEADNVIGANLYISRNFEGIEAELKYRNPFYRLNLKKLLHKYNLNNGNITSEDVDDLLELIEKDVCDITQVQKDGKTEYFKMYRGETKEILFYDIVNKEIIDTGVNYK
jgi:hypothetical protein